MRWLIIMIGILIALTTFLSHAESNPKPSDSPCYARCVEPINIDSCVQDEMEHWINISKKETIRQCEFLYQQEWLYCIVENCNYQLPKGEKND